MLPLLIYEPDEPARLRLMDALDTGPSGRRQVRVMLSTDSLEQMSRAIESESGIVAAILCPPAGKLEQCATLGNRLMEKNRANYAIFCLSDAAMMQEVFDYVMRPAGLLIRPVDSRRLNACLQRILLDYEAVRQPQQDDQYLLIEANSSVYRLAFSQIYYIEALDKLLTVHTENQNITVRKSLAGVSELLPEHFLRCHRSYVVNQHQIASVEYAEMQLTLKNGEILPVSRGQRASVRQAFDRQREVVG